MKGRPDTRANVIARYGKKIVLIEHIGANLVLPGSKQISGEALCETIEREFRERTGLSLMVTGMFTTVADEALADKDRRQTSTIYTGEAEGWIRDEDGKTRISLLAKDEIFAQRARFAFEQFNILQKYLLFSLGKRRPA